MYLHDVFTFTEYIFQKKKNKTFVLETIRAVRLWLRLSLLALDETATEYQQENNKYETRLQVQKKNYFLIRSLNFEIWEQTHKKIQYDLTVTVFTGDVLRHKCYHLTSEETFHWLTEASVSH